LGTQVRAGDNTVVTPGLAGGGREPAFPTTLPADRGGAPTAGSAPASFPYPGGCQQPIDGVIKDGKIDPSQVGFAVNALGQGFQLTNVSFSAMGQCQPDGSVKDPRLTLSTSYLHTKTKTTIYVTQMQQPKPDANVRYPGSATFWRDGYQYTVNGGYQVYPADGTTGGGGASSPGSAPPATPGIAPDYYPGPGSQPELEAVITEAIGQLAPGLEAACFYRETTGSWADLAAIGVGDPRPAIPQGYSESFANFAVFTAPDAACGLPATTPPPASFTATWESSDGGFIAVSASGLPAGAEQYPGYVGPDGANWSNGKHQFSVSGGGSRGALGLDAVRAIAKALDPQFEKACFFEQRTLTPADLAALGLRAPVPPQGYSITRSDLNASELGANCGNVPPGVGDSYNLNWDIAGPDDAQVNVNISRQEGQPDQEPGGYRSPSALSWWDRQGTFYNVNGYSKGAAGTVPEDVLIAIAVSIDPTLDPAKLDDEPKPIPVAEGRPPEPARR
jgi:hypothetical protein